MMVTARVQAGLAVITRLATQRDGAPLTTSSFSKTTGLSTSYLEVLCATLRRTGLIKSLRGPGGGYILGRAAHEISILDIALAVDPHAVDCATSGTSVAECTEESTPVNALFDRAASEMREFLQAKRLSEVVEDQRSPSLA
jgi:Rrf2 family iron-sulfur cluster assembly transcriptional regulator